MRYDVIYYALSKFHGLISKIDRDTVMHLFIAAKLPTHNNQHVKLDTFIPSIIQTSKFLGGVRTVDNGYDEREVGRWY